MTTSVTLCFLLLCASLASGVVLEVKSCGLWDSPCPAPPPPPAHLNFLVGISLGGVNVLSTKGRGMNYALLTPSLSVIGSGFFDTWLNSNGANDFTTLLSSQPTGTIAAIGITDDGATWNTNGLRAELANWGSTLSPHCPTLGDYSSCNPIFRSSWAFIGCKGCTGFSTQEQTKLQSSAGSVASLDITPQCDISGFVSGHTGMTLGTCSASISAGSQCEVSCAAGNGVVGSSTVVTCSDTVPATISPTDPTVHCEACSPGSYSVSATCEECASGTYATDSGATSCDGCPPGSATPSGSTSCTVCQGGTYSVGGEGSGSCTDCPVGRVSQANSTECEVCPGGYWSPGGYGSIVCRRCHEGTYNNAGSGTCYACPEGSYSNEERTGCGWCPPGQTSPAGSGCCNECNLGLCTSYTGSFCECLAYDDCAGQIDLCITYNAGCATCSACKAGYVPVGNACQVCGGGKYAPQGAATCLTCPDGQYGNGGLGYCYQCPENSFNNEEHTGCSWCSPGTFSPAGSSSCTACSVEYCVHYSQFCTCDVCESGYTVSGGICV